MPHLQRRVDFASTHFSDKLGRPFSLEGRDWVTEHFWKPADGFKLWPIDPRALCDQCKPQASTIVEDDVPHESQHPAHLASGCRGLFPSPILVTVLNLPRRSGKTFNTAAYSTSSCVQWSNKAITYVASAEDQTERLFEENWAIPIRASKALSKVIRLTATGFTVPHKKSLFECVSTSHGSITGRGRTTILVDEARDITARVWMALLPSILESHGVECPWGHMHAPYTPGAPTHCPACGEKLQRWYARAVVMSSSGLLEGGEKDWFSELVELLVQEPHPNFHLYRTDETINPDINKGALNAFDEVFSKIDATAPYARIEFHNTATRKGEDFLSKPQVDAIVDTSLHNVEGSERPSVAFLDTSTTVDKTSLVITADDYPESSSQYKPWDRLVVERIDVWEPAKLPGGVIDERLIQEHLDLYMPLFPALVSLHVDTRVMPWAVRLVKFCRNSRPWGRKVHEFHGNKSERSAAWTMLEHRILSGTLRIPPHADLRKELVSVRKLKDTNNQTEVRDSSRRIRHADVAEGLAETCRQAHLQSLKKGGSLGDVDRHSRAKEILDRLYKPHTRSIRETGF